MKLGRIGDKSKYAVSVDTGDNSSGECRYAVVDV